MERLVVLRSKEFLRHQVEGGHLESPERLEKLLEIFEKEEFSKIPQGALISATQTQLLKVHSRELIESLLEKKGKKGWIDSDTFFDPFSVDTALLATGSTAQLALDIWNKKVQRGFSLIRPPGHHATYEKSMGFCLLNNVAVSVGQILNLNPHARISIVDFDLHHGNGTQWIFYDNPNVQVISSHRYPYYPGTGNLNELGTGRAIGTTVNFPLDHVVDTKTFVSLYELLVFPMLLSFKPEMIFVSAGFDGHKEDPMKGFAICSEGFNYLIHRLSELADQLCGGRILFCLEGGYNPVVLKQCVENALKILLEASNKKKYSQMHQEKLDECLPLEKFKTVFRPYYPEI